MEPSLEAKYKHLLGILREAAPLVVAFSGGVDSAFLAWAARQTDGSDGVLAVIADSPSLPRQALADALDFARRHDIACETIFTHEVERADYARNDPGRCYFCKQELFARLQAEMERRPAFRTLAYGVNADDELDFRPGHRAAREFGVRAPLLEAGLSKAEIRAIARETGLEVWDRPAAACLASRVVHGIAVTPALLGRIETGEAALAGLGFRQFRLRHHGDDLARLEIAPEEIDRALDPAMARRIVAALKPLGYRYLALDLEGYRSGSLNPATVQIAAG